MMTLANIYRVYINDTLLPQTPSSITISNANKNEVETLANGRPFTLAKLDGAQKFEFDFVVTQKQYPWTFPPAVKGVRYFTDLVWQIKEDREPVTLTILRSRNQPSTCVTVLLDDYSYTEDAKQGSDYTFHVSFTEYHPQDNQEINADTTHHLITAGEARGWVDETTKSEQQDAAAQAQAEADDWNEKKHRIDEREAEAKKRADEEKKKQEEEEKKKEEEEKKRQEQEEEERRKHGGSV